MAKTKISEFSATPGNNTDIDGINIAEGCAPSGINDAIRELMSQLKDFQAGTAGDSFNGPVGTTTAAAGAFTTLSASSTVTLSGGTANGVAYLNGSKVLTTGSALTFDGTTLGVGALTVNSNNISAVNSLGFRNRIINGNMRIDQRNAGASVTPANGTTYVLDRWASSNAVTSKYSIQQNAGSVTPPAGFTNYLGCTSLSAYTVGAGENFNIQQAIEGFNVADLGWGTANAQAVTLSFWVRSSLTGTFGGALRNSATTRSYPFSFTINAANTWEYKSISIAGDTTGTWLTNNGIGIHVIYSLGTGATFSGTAGAWASANYVSATGATSVVGTNGATFYITGVQLEAGSVATPFERRPYGTELALCQRYFEKSFSQDVAVGTATVNGRLIYTTGILGGANSILATTITFAAEKRAAPTMSTWDANGNAGRITTFNEAAGPTQNVTSNIGFGETSTRSTRLAQQGQVAGFGCSWTASAEL